MLANREILKKKLFRLVVSAAQGDKHRLTQVFTSIDFTMKEKWRQERDRTQIVETK